MNNAAKGKLARKHLPFQAEWILLMAQLQVLPADPKAGVLMARMSVPRETHGDTENFFKMH